MIERYYNQIMCILVYLILFTFFAIVMYGFICVASPYIIAQILFGALLLFGFLLTAIHIYLEALEIRRIRKLNGQSLE